MGGGEERGKEGREREGGGGGREGGRERGRERERDNLINWRRARQQQTAHL